MLLLRLTVPVPGLPAAPCIQAFRNIAMHRAGRLCGKLVAVKIPGGYGTNGCGTNHRASSLRPLLFTAIFRTHRTKHRKLNAPRMLHGMLRAQDEGGNAGIALLEFDNTGTANRYIAATDGRSTDSWQAGWQMAGRTFFQTLATHGCRGTELTLHARLAADPPPPPAYPPPANKLRVDAPEFVFAPKKQVCSIDLQSAGITSPVRLVCT